MATLDATTQAEYAAEVNAADRAQVIIDALTDPVYVRVYDSDDNVIGEGTMTSPWAEVIDDLVIPKTLDNFFVSSVIGGTPNDNWYLKFESGTRYVRCSFGLSGSGQEAIWSLPDVGLGYRAGIISGAITVSGNRPPLWTAAPATISAVVGATQSFAGYASDPDGDQIVFSLVAATGGYSITTSGVLTVGAASQSVTIRASDPNGLYADHACAVTVIPSNLGTVSAGSGFEEFAVGFQFSNITYSDFAYGGRGRQAATNGSKPIIVSTPIYAGARSFEAYMPAQGAASEEYYRSECYMLPRTGEAWQCQQAYSAPFDHYIGFALRLNASFPTGTTSIPTTLWQYASDEAPYAGSNPRWGLRFLSNGNWGITTEYFGASASTFDSGVSIASAVGVWTRVQIHARYYKAATAGAGLGFVRLYLNGALVRDTGYMTTIDTNNVGYYKFGLYCANRRYYADAVRTTHFDAIRIATSTNGGTLATVDPGNY